MFLLWLIFIFAGYNAKRLYPDGVLYVVVGSAALLGISLMLATFNPLFDSEAAFAPASLGYNYLIKLILATVMFLIGYGVAKVRRRAA